MANDKLMYHDYTSDFKSRGERYGWSHTNFDKIIGYYDLSKLPDVENAAEPYIAYILMSRPSFNLALTGSTKSSTVVDERAYSNMDVMRQLPMTAAFANDKYGQKLLMSMSDYSANPASPWLPLITTKAMSYSVSDMELKTVEKGNTYFGHVLKYGKHSEEHKISSTLAIEFRNDRYLSVLKMIYLWMAYIYQVSKGSAIQPKMVYQTSGILDYAASIYYLVTRRDGRELVYWEKLVGVFPTRAPFSIFSSNDTMIMEDRFQVEFAYGIKNDPCDPSILMDINVLSGDDLNYVIPVKSQGIANLPRERFLNNKETPFVKGNVYALNPYIVMQKDYDGTLKYFLKWEGW